MNFYKHHIGDYDQATRHLSFAEDGAYCRLIRKYYAEEAPLPSDLKKILRLIGARTKEEKAAVETVLEEFFVLEADGWHNTRCDAELKTAWAKASKNREVGKLGGRPRKTETQTKPKDNPNGYELKTQTVSENNPSQTPDTRHQTKADDDSTDSGSAVSSAESEIDMPPADDFGAPKDAPLPMREQPPLSEDPAVQLSVALRRLGVNVMSTNPYLLAWVADGVPLSLLTEAVSVARENKPDPEKIAPGYLVPIVHKLRNPSAGKHGAATPAGPIKKDWI